jgi:ABC-2 type transport system ATP-binding protein
MSAPALRIAGLSHRYGARLALDGVSLNVAPGEFRVLLGPNGAGKSTLYGLLTRLLACQSGAIELFGLPLSAPAMAGLGVVFQQPTLDLDLTVEQNLAISC